jgi:hypothetical protein
MKTILLLFVLCLSAPALAVVPDKCFSEPDAWDARCSAQCDRELEYDAYARSECRRACHREAQRMRKNCMDYYLYR